MTHAGLEAHLGELCRAVPRAKPTICLHPWTIKTPQGDGKSRLLTVATNGCTLVRLDRAMGFPLAHPDYVKQIDEAIGGPLPKNAQRVSASALAKFVGPPVFAKRDEPCELCFGLGKHRCPCRLDLAEDGPNRMTCVLCEKGVLQCWDCQGTGKQDKQPEIDYIKIDGVLYDRHRMAEVLIPAVATTVETPKIHKIKGEHPLRLWNEQYLGVVMPCRDAPGTEARAPEFSSRTPAKKKKR